jgi:hypothetical protein
MKKTTYIICFTVSFISLLSTHNLAQTILYEERFSGGISQLIWDAGFGGDTMVVANVTGNPSGDGWVGALGNKWSGGFVGLTYAGDKTLKNYSVEAQVFLNVQATSGGPYAGLVAYRDTANGQERFYGLIADFDSDKRLMLRRYQGASPTLIKSWSTDIPGGAPTESRWQKLGLTVSDGQIWAYYDDNLLPECPFVDTTYKSGYFGAYYFNMADDSKTTLYDDIIVKQAVTSVKDITNPGIPENHSLSQNYPNPFNPSTNISYKLNQAQNVSLIIYDILGEKVKTLVSQYQSAGYYTVTWNGQNDAGYSVKSGIYLYTLRSGDIFETKKMLMLR